MLKVRIRAVWIVIAVVIFVVFSGCTQNTSIISSTEASPITTEIDLAVIDRYNTRAENVNSIIIWYNAAIHLVNEQNNILENKINSAQAILSNGSIPYDPSTEQELQAAIDDAISEMVPIPNDLQPFDVLSPSDHLSNQEKNMLATKAEAAIAELDSFNLPAMPSLPNYTSIIEAIDGSLAAYQNSVKSFQQITAPSDQFVINRLGLIDSITNIEAVTESHDPNGMLNKENGYVGCVYFLDKNVDSSGLVIEPGKDGPVDIGCIGGGAIEIFKTSEDAEKRDAFLTAIDETTKQSGSHHVHGTLVIRTSSNLSAEEQAALTGKIVDMLIMVDG